MYELDGLDENKIIEIINSISEETSTIELKKDWPNAVSIEQTVCAMSNSNGGIILIGITNDRKIEGISDPGELNSRISGMMGNSNPIPSFITKKIFLKNGRYIAVIIVSSHFDKPVQSANGAFHLRMEGKNGWLQRSQLRDIFILKDLKQVRKTKIISIIHQIIRNIDNETSAGGALVNGNRSIVFEKLMISELMMEIHNYPYFLENKIAQEQLDKLFEICNTFLQRKMEFETEREILLHEKYGATYVSSEGFIMQLQNKTRYLRPDMVNDLLSLKGELNDLLTKLT